MPGHRACINVFHNAPDCFDAGLTPEEMCSECRSHAEALTAEPIVADRTERMGETYRWVDAARHEAEVLRASAWVFEDRRPAMAANLRAAVEVLTGLAEALEMEEIEGKDAIDALLARVPFEADHALASFRG